MSPPSRPAAVTVYRRKRSQGIHRRNRGLRLRLLRLRQRRLARYFRALRHSLRRLPPAPATASTRTTATAPSPTSPKSRTAANRLGLRRHASATTTTTASRTSSSPTGARTCFTATTATAPSPMSPRSRPGRLRNHRWGTGCTFLDYDRDGHLDLFVSNYLEFDLQDRSQARPERELQLDGYARELRPARPSLRPAPPLPQ